MTSTPQGLSSAEAAIRLRDEGFNELPRANRRTPLRIFAEVLREPMLALLIVGGLIYLLLGDLQEALILLAFACLSVAITVVQESRTERVLEALRDLTSPRALVIRDGVHRRIAGREVVRGDLVLLSEGDRVPADADLLNHHDLQVDESLLTGESVPVRRMQGDIAFAGTLVVRGTALAKVNAIGAASEIGKIGASLRNLTVEQPRLQQQTRALVRTFAILGGAVSILAVLLYGSLRGEWLDAVLAGIALGMAMLPEEFPVVLTVFMAMGAWRISRARVLTRRASAIEILGSATVLCTDKTGTLTENRMSIAQICGADFIQTSVNSPQYQDIAALGRMACTAEPHDPMEKAFHDISSPPMGEMVAEYGLRPDLMAMTQVWNGPDGLLAAAKGAPEAIADLCNLSAEHRAKLSAVLDDMAHRGLRVLGVAQARPKDKHFPDTQRGFRFQFAGLVGLADPLRASVPAAMRDAAAAGIRVIMITGDYAETARAIGQQAGLPVNHVISGDDMRAMSDDDLRKAVVDVTIFARIKPDQKLRIITALKANGEIVAMTGDGVNDAPSLKAAHIGIAMGGRGTDVAREASSIVLLDDDFGSIVESIRLGRRIYDNLRKAIGFIFAVHVPIAGLALLPLLFGLPILFGPIHIAFLEMVIDPVCSLVFEAEEEESDVMSRPPRAPDSPLFSRWLMFGSLMQGAVAFGMVAIIYLTSLWRGMPVDEVRALAFVALVFGIVALIFANRAFSTNLLTAFRRHNRTLGIVLSLVAVVLAVVLLWPTARALFSFGALNFADLLLAVAGGLGVLFALEAAKTVLKRTTRG